MVERSEKLKFAVLSSKLNELFPSNLTALIVSNITKLSKEAKEPRRGVQFCKKILMNSDCDDERRRLVLLTNSGTNLGHLLGIHWRVCQ